jgi:hypothetical protein
MAINTVSQSNNFETWRTITNEVVNKVNFLDSTGITGITGGNAIGITTDGNKSYTVRFTGNVAGTVTFSGPVTFQNTLTASSLNVTSTKIPYTIPSGLTIGNFVRVDSTTGLTFAKADTADNAEILGMVVSSSQIAISGQIDNSTFANTIQNSLGIVGGTLGKGSVYFLSPTVAGGITTIEPIAYGQVSKPILLGITGDQGMLLPYRGVVIEGISAGITAELDNKIIIELNYSGLVGFTNGSNYSSPTGIKLGDPVFYFTSDTNIGGGNTDPTVFLQGIKDTAGLNNTVRVKVAGVDSQNELAFFVPDWQNCTVGVDVDGVASYEYIGSKPIERGRILGLVSEIVATPTSLGQDKYILEVTLPGGSVAFSDLSQLDSTFYYTTSSGSYYIQPHQSSQGAYGSTSLLSQAAMDSSDETIERYKFLDIIKYSAFSGKIIFHYKTQPLFLSEQYGGEGESAFVASFLPSSSGTAITGPSQFYNLLPNGAFTVWQRPFSGLTAGQINSNLYLTPVADRWFWTNWGVTGLTLSLTRSQFNSNQTEIPGSPLYYVNINTQYGLPLADPAYAPRLENIQKNARLLQGQTATLSFYAKSTVSGSTLDLTFNRYPEGIQDDFLLFETALEGRQTIVAGITLTGSWAKYSQTFVVPVMGYTLTTEQDGWISFGFEFPRSSATLSIAQVILEQGYGSNMVGYINPQDELQRCKPYYQRSYDIDEAPQSTNSRGNEQVIQLGNLNGQSIYSVKFPTKMIETPSPSFITIYSPVTGTPTETYNVNAGQDLRYTTGTLIGYPWDVTPQYRQGAGLTGNVTIPNSSQHGFDIQLNSGAVSFDTIKFHWIANSDILYRG